MKNNGFTLIELLIVIFILFVVVGGIGLGLLGGVCMGNFWVGEQSALKAVQVVDESATSVINLERRIWRYSRVTVKENTGERRQFYLNSSILQSVSAYPAN